METKDILTIVGLAVSLGGLIATLFKLSVEQTKANELRSAEIDARLSAEKARVNAEKRTDYKLRIYQSLIDNRLTFDELVSLFREQNPLSDIDQIELRKCVYEMLVEGTLITYEDKTFTSDTVDDDDDGEEEDDDDDEDEDEDDGEEEDEE